LKEIKRVMQAVLYKIPGQEWRWLGGMTLLERNLRLLGGVGVKKALVLHPPTDQLPLFTTLRALSLEVVHSPLEIATADPLTILPTLREEVDEPFFLLDVNLLVDPRVLETIAKQIPPCFMVLGNGAYPPPWRIGWLSPRHLSQGNEVLRKAQRLSLLAVPLYNPDLREETTPYCEKMLTESDLRRGWRLLIEPGAKHPADLVGKYLTSPIENWFVHTFCETAVTPNQVTLLSLAFALAGASLFYQGWFFLALLFSWVAMIFDGVDDKLARVKLLTSPGGTRERLISFCCENIWYLALAARLARTHDPVAWKVGLLIIVCNALDSVLGAFFRARKGRTLEEMTRFDRGFRLIGGRRGVSLLILLVGFVVGAPVLALQAVLGWAAVTVFIHAGRAAYHLLRRNSEPV
jgi:phosphatidylglycerophosphate synthase